MEEEIVNSKIKIKLSDHFTYKKLFKFVFPSIVMLIFVSIYGVVDGLFVSNFAGEEALAAVNLMFPFLMILATFGFMMGSGGSALVSKTLGEKDKDRANRYFSMIVYFNIIIGLVCSVLGFFLSEPVAIFFKAEGITLDYCILYGRILSLGVFCFSLQNAFQSLFITANRPKLGLGFTIAAGVTNMILDFLFIGVFKWGIIGAALATVIGQAVGGVLPLFYFASLNHSLLRLVKTKLEIKPLLKSMFNGSSEMVNNISMSLVSMIYNFQLMNIAGNDGVNAYGIVMYISFIFISGFIGYSIGTAPIVGYHFGAKNKKEVQNVLYKSIKIIFTTSFVIAILSFVCARLFAKMFVGYDEELLQMTTRAQELFALNYIFAGLNIYSSSFFTALNNGLMSAIQSFSRTLIFQIAMVFILPLFLGLDGIWLATPTAELLAFLVNAVIFILNKNKYGYFDNYKNEN